MLRHAGLSLIGLLFLSIVACGDTGENANNSGGDNNLGADLGDSDMDIQDMAPMGWPDIAITDDGFMEGFPELIDFNDDENIVEVYITAAPQLADLGEEMLVETYAYNGVLPGPLLLANVGDEVIVHFKNELPEPTTIHWHGLRISDKMDGNPRIMNPVKTGEEFTYRFVVPDAGTYWYHPHLKTNEQIEKGLYGALVVREADAPDYDAERYIAIDDILLNGNQIAPFLESHPEIMHGRSGNALITNGKTDVLSLVAKEGQVERWHLVNPANARTMSLSITGATWRVIGVDGGRVEPYETERLQMAVGQRFDVEISYDESGFAEMQSNVLTTENNEIVEIAIPIVRVQVAATGIAPIAVSLPPAPVIADVIAGQDAEVIFDAVQDSFGNVIWTLNGISHNNAILFTYQKGDVVKIKLRNMVGPEHPFHLHGQFFTIVDKGTPETSQPGLKDTVLLLGQSEVEIIARFDNPGQWMAHCHINEHAEMGMMASIIVEE